MALAEEGLPCSFSEFCVGLLLEIFFGGGFSFQVQGLRCLCEGLLPSRPKPHRIFSRTGPRLRASGPCGGLAKGSLEVSGFFQGPVW